MTGAPTHALNITVLVDGGLLESYANSRVVISSLLSPSVNRSSAPEARQVRAFASGAAASGLACEGKAWGLETIDQAP